MRTTSGIRRERAVLIAGDPSGIREELVLRFALEGDEPVILDPRESPSGGGQDALAGLEARFKQVDALVVLLTPADAVPSPDALTREALLSDLAGNSWPLVEYTRRIHAVFGAYPRYVLSISASRPERQEGVSHPDAAESLNEVFARYMSYHLFASGVAVNTIRVDPHGGQPDADAVAKLAFALTSGLMDAVRGQTFVLRGGGPASNRPARAAFHDSSIQ